MCIFEVRINRILRSFSLCVLLAAAWETGLTQGFAQPANDNIANFRVLTGGIGTTTGINDGATRETGERDHAGNAGGRSVWFRWTPTANGIAAFDTIGSDFDTLLEVYRGTGISNVTQLASPLASNDDLDAGAFGHQDFSGASGVHLQVTAGVVYYIVIDGYNANSGGYKLNWKRGGARSAGEFEFTAPTYFVSETEGFTPWDPNFNRDIPGAYITVTRKNGSNGKVLVNYTTQNDSAIADANYVATTGTLVFEDHQMSASFVVPILNNGGSGMEEIFTTDFNVRLTAANLDPAESSNLAPPVLSPDGSLAIVTIADVNPTPDDAGTVQFTRASYRRLEGVGMATIEVSRSGGDFGQAVTVTYAINYSPVGPDLGNQFRLSPGSDYATPNTETNGDYTVPPAELQACAWQAHSGAIGMFAAT